VAGANHGTLAGSVRPFRQNADDRRTDAYTGR